LNGLSTISHIEDKSFQLAILFVQFYLLAVVHLENTNSDVEHLEVSKAHELPNSSLEQQMW